MSNSQKNSNNSQEKKKKVLLVGDANGYFRIDYARNLKDENIQIDILSFTKCKPENLDYYNRVIECSRKSGSGKILTLKYFIDFLVCLIKLSRYDIVHIHSVKVIHSLYSLIIRMKCKTLISSMYGSDMYRVSNFDRLILHWLFNRSKYITVESDDMKNDFIQYFGKKYASKIAKVPFGVTQLGYIKAAKNDVSKIKKELNIPAEKIVLSIGYNATKEQHHKEILELLRKDDRFKDLYVIIPLSYGDNNYKTQITNLFNETGLQGKCFCDFWPIEEVCKLRVISDIMIQVQDTDAFSTSMIEYMYSGNVIITGSWLPYSIISDYINVVDSIDDIPSLLHDILQDITSYKNKSYNALDFIENNYSWDYLKHKWLKLYE